MPFLLSGICALALLRPALILAVYPHWQRARAQRLLPRLGRAERWGRGRGRGRGRAWRHGGGAAGMRVGMRPYRPGELHLVRVHSGAAVYTSFECFPKRRSWPRD